MQCSPQELKERLLRAIDQDHNVVDMPTVLDIFSLLEKHPISREILEQTRMGLHVNEIRRKTESKELAKRARQLLRGWQKLLHSSTPIASPAAPSPTVNGEGVSVGRAVGTVGNGASISKPKHLLAGSGDSKPASPASRPATPASGRPAQSPLPPYPGSVASTPTSSRPGTPAGYYPPNTPASHTSRLSPKTSSAIRPTSAAAACIGRITSPALSHGSSGHSGGSPGLPQLSQSQSKYGTQPVPAAKVNSNSRPGTPTEILSKKNVANKRKRRDQDSPGSDQRDYKQHHHNHPKNLATSCDTFSNVCEGSQPPSTPSSGGIKITIKKDRTVNGLVSHTNVSVEGVDTSQNGTSSAADRSYSSSSRELTRTPTFPHTSTPAGAESLSRQSGLASKRNASSLSLKTDFSERVSQFGDGPSKGLERTHSSASLSSQSSKTPKVKTTAQLLKGLHESGDLTLRSSETVTKIVLNQIEKEDDPDLVSVVPAGARPRPRRKPGSMFPPTLSGVTLSQTKEEQIQRFLQTSETPSPLVAPSPDPDLSSLLQLDPPLEPEPEPIVVEEDIQDSSPLALHRQDEDMEIQQQHPTFNGSQMGMAVDWRPADLPAGAVTTVLTKERSQQEQEQFLRDPWSFLPDLDAVDLSDEFPDITDEEVENRGVVTERGIERLHTEEWSGVNGQYDHQDVWHDWTATYSMPSYQGQLLHILPYVNIDD